MFKRKIYDEMINWKNQQSSQKRALVIKGLRQVGKTYIAQYFAKNNYKNVIYINFKNNESIKKVFADDLEIERIIIDLSANIPNANFVPKETVLIFDEIQECSNARASLKVFVEDGRFDVICTGSLLGVKGYNRSIGKGIPVGYEQIIYMNSMDFEEFLWAKGLNNTVIDYLKECYNEKKPIRENVHKTLMRYFKEYICVGGLPSIVDVFITSSDMNKVRWSLLNLIDEYKDDFGKHININGEEKVDMSLLSNINKVFDSIPSQLSKENKKFFYSEIEKKGRGKKFDSSIQWLKDYGLINIAYNLSTLQLPLEGNKISEVFKIYFRDSGLFIASLDDSSIYANILNNDLKIYKGAIYENIIADAFSKNNIKLFYYHKESGLEIDFITRLNDKIVLIEVKSRDGNTKSSKTILKSDKYDVDTCIKLGDYNIGCSNNILTIPLYLAFLIK